MDPKTEKVEETSDLQREYAGPGPKKDVLDIQETDRGHLNAVFENPLANVPREQLMKDVEEFCHEFDLMDHVDLMKQGALVAQNPSSYQDMPEISDEDKMYLEREKVCSPSKRAGRNCI